MKNSTKSLIAAVVVGAAVSTLLFSPAQSATANCGQRSTIVLNLEEKYKEYQQTVGIADGTGMVVEVYANTVSGTWTILTTNVMGTSCLIAAGVGYEHNNVLADEET